jgi:hypothetical protein
VRFLIEIHTALLNVEARGLIKFKKIKIKIKKSVAKKLRPNLLIIIE